MMTKNKRQRNVVERQRCCIIVKRRWESIDSHPRMYTAFLWRCKTTVILPNVVSRIHDACVINERSKCRREYLHGIRRRFRLEMKRQNSKSRRWWLESEWMYIVLFAAGILFRIFSSLDLGHWLIEMRELKRWWDYLIVFYETTCPELFQ